MPPVLATNAPIDTSYDVEKVRAHFPILSRTINGHPLVYLDSAASAQKPRAVIERMIEATYCEYANVHRGSHTLGNAATAAFEAARDRVRLFLGAADADEIVFTKSATEAINLVAASFGTLLAPGDEIVLSVMEHHANLVPWHMLRARHGVVLRWVDVDDYGDLQVAAIERAITPRTKLVAVTHMSNVLGSPTPLAEIVAVAHAHGVPVLADGTQAAVHLPIDVRALDVDFYVVTGHKLYGPTGIGALYGKRAWLERLPPFMGGGEMVERVTRDAVTYAAPPHRFEAGTPPIVQAIGFGEALDFIETVGQASIAAHERALGDYARQRLSALSKLRVVGGLATGPIVTFILSGMHPHDAAALLDAQGICIRAGSHCAQPLLARYGLDASCRASFAMYTTFNEVDRLTIALEAASAMTT